MHTLEFENVSKSYSDAVVVDDMTFTVQPGRVTGFLGPNGAGKSTTLKILLDLASADHGHASIGGTRNRDLDDPARTVGAILEANAFHPSRTGRNHLRILADSGGYSHDRIDELLELVGLADAADRKAGAYSLGMRQRLGLAAAVLPDPPVLGAGIGALVRNTGGAVVGAVLVLVILPPLAIQLASGAASWIPGTLVSVLSGVVDDPGLPAALLALAAWSLVPALIGLIAVQRRDVV